MRVSRWFQRSRAVRRSLSCSAIVNLHSKRLIDACADMYQAFEERSPDRRVPRKPSLPTLEEENESSSSGSFVCHRTQSFTRSNSNECPAYASESQSAFAARHLSRSAWSRPDSTAEALADERATEAEA